MVYLWATKLVRVQRYCCPVFVYRPPNRNTTCQKPLHLAPKDLCTMAKSFPQAGQHIEHYLYLSKSCVFASQTYKVKLLGAGKFAYLVHPKKYIFFMLYCLCQTLLFLFFPMSLSPHALQDFEDILAASTPSLPSEDIPQIAAYLLDLYTLFIS